MDINLLKSGGKLFIPLNFNQFEGEFLNKILIS